MPHYTTYVAYDVRAYCNIEVEADTPEEAWKLASLEARRAVERGEWDDIESGQRQDAAPALLPLSDEDSQEYEGPEPAWDEPLDVEEDRWPGAPAQVANAATAGAP